MEVRFTKVDGKRYAVAIQRTLGPPLVPRFGPGNDDLMPHDIAHFLVEEHFGIELGVWGQLAAGGGGIFWPTPEDNTLRYQRSAQRISAVGRDDMQRSERLVVMTVAAWERSIKRVEHVTGLHSDDVDAEELAAAVRRMNDVAEQWRNLERGGSLTFTWPRHLTFSAVKSRRGRRTTRATPAMARR
jgi:hypothetical protein